MGPTTVPFPISASPWSSSMCPRFLSPSSHQRLPVADSGYRRPPFLLAFTQDAPPATPPPIPHHRPPRYLSTMREEQGSVARGRTELAARRSREGRHAQVRSEGWSVRTSAAAFCGPLGGRRSTGHGRSSGLSGGVLPAVSWVVPKRLVQDLGPFRWNTVYVGAPGGEMWWATGGWRAGFLFCRDDTWPTKSCLFWLCDGGYYSSHAR
jgi:hypothetical protein